MGWRWMFVEGEVWAMRRDVMYDVCDVGVGYELSHHR